MHANSCNKVYVLSVREKETRIVYIQNSPLIIDLQSSLRYSGVNIVSGNLSKRDSYDANLQVLEFIGISEFAAQNTDL